MKKIINLLFNAYALVMARPGLQSFNRLLVMLGLKGLGVLNWQNERVSGEAYFMRAVLPRLLQSDDPVFFDIGANVGKYTRALQDQYPRATIHAFEPNPVSYEKLRALAGNTVIVHNCAVGDAEGELVLYDIQGESGSELATLYPEVIRDLNHRGTKPIPVSVVTLDFFAAKREIQHVDLLKIDTEGHEFAVLKGAARLLSEKNVSCVHFEFNSMNAVSRVFFRDFRMLLEGYRFYRLLPNGLLFLDDSPLFTEIYTYQNIIAVPAEIVPNLSRRG